MRDDNRGRINNRAQAAQIRDFSGLRFGNITPTDIDGHIEYHNLCHIFIELKYGNAVLPMGQRIALERLCDDIRDKPAIALVASHQNSVGEDIDVSKAIVTEIRWRGTWRVADKDTVRGYIERFIKWVDFM